MTSKWPRASLVASLLLLACAAPAVGQEKFLSHSPMRPLPAATKRPLEKGPTYFVDAVKGDDKNDGSEARPWRTVQHGANRLRPGDTLYLRGGAYYEKVRLTRSGTAAAPIVLARVAREGLDPERCFRGPPIR